MRRRGFAGIVLLLALALPASASGATLYVEKGGEDTDNNCLNAGSPCLTIQHAVDEASPDDAIQIGPGEFVESVEADKVLTFQGAGSGTPDSIVGATRVQGTTDHLSPGKPAFNLPNGGTLRNLQAVGGEGTLVLHPGGPGLRFDPEQDRRLYLEDIIAMGGRGFYDLTGLARGGTGLEVDGQDALAEVLVTGSTFFGGEGGIEIPVTPPIKSNYSSHVVILGEQAKADFIDSTFGSLEETDPPTGLQAGQGADVSLEDSRVGGFVAVLLSSGAKLSIERSFVVSESVGLYLISGGLGGDVEADVNNSAVVGIGPAAFVQSGSDAPHAVMYAQGSTFYSQAGQSAVYVLDGPGGPADAHLLNSIARISSENPEPAARDLIASGGTITADYSSFTSVGGTGVLPKPGSANNISGDPGLMVAEESFDLRLRPDSPLIDRGDPSVVAPGELDLDRSPRSLDGNGDCVAAPDVGAFELTGHECPPTPPPTATPPVDLPPELSRFGMTNRVFAPKGKAKPRRGARAAARAKRGTKFNFTLSEPARVAIAIERKVRRRKRVRFTKVGTLTASKQGGRQSLPFSGRLKGKPLRPGRYRATIVATDQSGQRSQPRRTTFRVASRFAKP